MNWKIDPGGGVAGDGRNSATDADEDMGFALVMADKQWGGYASTAKDFLKKVSTACFGSDGTIKAGDNYVAVNPSYLAPAFYRTFAKYTGDSRWMTILDKSYQILQGTQNSTTGLVPDWSSGRSGPNYGYDAARTPYRIALDACWNNEPRAISFSQTIAKFFAGVGAANIKDGYEVGTGNPMGPNTNSTFVGPAGTSAMPAKQTKLLDDAYAFVAADGNKGTESYFNLSWALFSALMMTGNIADLTQY
jgi:endo-1,4-beta-D-glucanase Y